MAHVKDRTGEKYGLLTFIRPTKERKQGKAVWELRCDCGNTVSLRGDSVVSGGVVSCGCVLRKMWATVGQRSRKHEPRISTARQIWAVNYKDCPFDLFLHLSQQPCHYCGRKPHRTGRTSPAKIQSTYQKQYGDFTYNGLDRVDSSKGHEEGNVVPSCWDCNHMKGKRTAEEFLAHIRRVHAHASDGGHV